MSTSTEVAERRSETPAAVFRNQFERMSSEISAALPPHIPAERFMRVVLTAVNGNPDLLKADRKSLFEASMKSAQDGLLPDGRDGAFVVFNAKTKVKDDNGREREVYINKVQWMPMVAGILKKVRNSGALISIGAHVAYDADRFLYVLGDEERIEHEPALGANRGKPKAVYAIAKTKDGGIYREVMTVAEVEKVRNVSRAKNSGPWVQWWDEMARKTVIRRLSKRLPMSTDLDDLIRRDDELYDFNKNGRAEGQTERMFQPVENPLQDTIDHDTVTGEVLVDGQDPAPASFGESPDRAGEGAGTKPQEAGPAPTNAARQRGHTAEEAQADRVVDGDGKVLKDKGPTASQDGAQAHWQRVQDARAAGIEAAKRPNARKNPPSELKGDGREDEHDAWIEGFDLGRSGEAEG